VTTTDTDTELHVRGKNLDTINAVVRTLSGIADVQFVNGDWLCSEHGPGECLHSAHVVDHLADVVAS
jgi:hypothetical protein